MAVTEKANIYTEKANIYDSLDVPNEAPPSYDDVNPSSSSSSQRTAAASARRQTSVEKSRSEGFASTPCTDRSAYRRSYLPDSSSIPGPSGVGKTASSVISAKVQADVRETVRGLVRNVVQGVSSGRLSPPEALAVLDSCSAACMKHSLSLAEILQERSIEGRSAVYWGIVSRTTGREETEERDTSDGRPHLFLFDLLSYAAPLSPVGVSELRAACLAISDNTLFQRLRTMPGIVPLSGADRMLIAGSGRTSVDVHGSELERLSARQKQKAKEDVYAFDDDAEVQEGRAGGREVGDSFRVRLQVRMFQRRMRISSEVAVEFIALGRLWLLIFFVVPDFPAMTTPLHTGSTYSGPRRRASDLSTTSTNTAVAASMVPRAALEAAKARKLTPGTWAVALGLLEGSVQCYAQARIIVTDQTSSSQAEVDLLSYGENDESARPALNQKPPIILDLTAAGSSPLVALDNTVVSENSDSSYRRVHRDRESRRGRRQRLGVETYEDQQERARLAETVLLSGFEDVPASWASPGVNDRASGKQLMYDGCPYFAPDGSLNAVLEARLLSAPPGPRLSDCIIC